MQGVGRAANVPVDGSVPAPVAPVAPVAPFAPFAPAAPIALAGSTVRACWVKVFVALPTDVATVKSTNNAADRSIVGDDAAVFTSLKTVSGALVVEARSIARAP